MKIDYSHFWSQKAGTDASECEDAFFPHNLPFDKIPLFIQFQRYAIADGASTAYLSGLWATTLVYGFGLYEEEITKSNFLDLLQTTIIDEKWNSELEDYKTKREMQGKPLSWFDEMALQNGAASTLLEISIPLDNQLINQFSAIAIGDSCLFQIRSNDLITKFPLTNSGDFNNSPILISSVQKRNVNLPENIAYIENQSINPDDQIFLMTDALASWFLQEHEKEGKPWNIICENAIDQSSFENWIDELRENKTMRNDDVTLMILNIQGD